MKQPDELAEQLHNWYLEAVKQLDPESYNPNARRAYGNLTEEQKFIDIYIADKVNALRKRDRLELLDDLYTTPGGYQQVVNTKELERVIKSLRIIFPRTTSVITTDTNVLAWALIDTIQAILKGSKE